MKDVDEIARSVDSMPEEPARKSYYFCRRLAKILSLNGYEENLKEAAQLDYFVAGY